MSQEQSSRLQAVDQNGVRGTLDLTVVPPQGGSESKLILIRFDDGSSVFADAAVFVEQEPGVFFFPGSFAALRQGGSQSSANVVGVQQQQQQATAPTASAASGEQLVIPVLAEQIRIARQQVVTGGVRVHKTVRERVETVDEPVLTEEVHVERIPINRFVAEAPSVRYEGDTMILPLLEEVMVVEKRLVLREEIRVSKSRDVVRKPQQVVLRREEVQLENIEPNRAPTGD